MKIRGWYCLAELAFALFLVFFPFSTPANAGLIINVSYNENCIVNTCTTVPVAAETAFNQLVTDYENLFTNNITVNIDVDFGTTVLGASSTAQGSVTYSQFQTALFSNATANPGNFYEANAAASLPTNDPIGDSEVRLRCAEIEALALFSPSCGALDSTLVFSNSQNFSYSNAATTGEYDFMDVAAHELDEALGIGSALTGIANNGSLPSEYDAEDYFRFSAPATLDETTNPNAVVYFSYNGGVTNVAQFNQDNDAAGNTGGVDRNDWVYGDNGCPAYAPGPYIQDAVGCSDEAVEVAVVGSPEVIVLNTLGFDSTSYGPEPGSILLFMLGLGSLAVFDRKRLARSRCQ